MYKKAEIREEEGEGETDWESRIDIYTIAHIK